MAVQLWIDGLLYASRYHCKINNSFFRKGVLPVQLILAAEKCGEQNPEPQQRKDCREMMKWEKMPERFRNEAVKEYYEILEKRKVSLIVKRVFDIFTALIITVIALPFMLKNAEEVPQDVDIYDL